MRLGTVIGTVTLGVRSAKYLGERLLLVQPWKPGRLQGRSEYDPAIVVYDELGAGVGQEIAISEGREAACPFQRPTPVDAYCAALVDTVFYEREEK
jgi:microcompartment protein CcmK/EutM